MIKRIHLLIFPLISAWLSGCATLTLPSETPVHFNKIPWTTRQAELMTIKNWDIAGAFSLREPKQTVIANYEWQQTNKNYVIQIHSSLNVYSVAITGDENNVVLWRSRTEHYSAPTPEILLQQQLGWQLPISNLYYWIRGLPAPGRYHTQLDAYGHISNLTQQGWKIEFQRYTTVNNIDVPEMLQLTRQNLAVKIVVKTWGMSTQSN